MDENIRKKCLTEKEVAERYNFGLVWLRQKRSTGGGIPFLKIGRKVLYRTVDVERFLDERLVSSTSEVVRHV